LVIFISLSVSGEETWLEELLTATKDIHKVALFMLIIQPDKEGLEVLLANNCAAGTCNCPVCTS